jgi:hypothetical protein
VAEVNETAYNASVQDFDLNVLDPTFGEGESVQDVLDPTYGEGKAAQDVSDTNSGEGESVQDVLDPTSGEGKSAQDVKDPISGKVESVQEFDLNVSDSTSGESLSDRKNAHGSSADQPDDKHNDIFEYEAVLEDSVVVVDDSDCSVGGYDVASTSCCDLDLQGSDPKVARHVASIW